MPTSLPSDTINLRSLHTTAIIGSDAWSRPHRAQPLTLSISLALPTRTAGISDDIGHTFSYGTMCKDVLATVEGKEFERLGDVTRAIIRKARVWPGARLRVEVVARKAILRCEGGLGTEVVCERDGLQGEAGWKFESERWMIGGLKCACVIGVNSCEREEKQGVVLELGVLLPDEHDSGDEAKELKELILEEGDAIWRRIVRRVCDVTEASSFQTLEALAALIASTCLKEVPIPCITVKVEKPSALTFVDGAGVEITRDREWLWQQL